MNKTEKYFTLIKHEDEIINKIKNGLNTIQLKGDVSMWYNKSGIRFHNKDITCLFVEKGNIYEVSDFKYKILLNSEDGLYRTDTANLQLIGSVMDLNTIRYMIENGMDMNSNNGYIAFWFCRHGDPSILKYLIENGLNLNVCGQECLRAACEEGNLDKAKLLIDNGVNIYAKEYQPFISALYFNHFNIVDYLIDVDKNTKIDYQCILDQLGGTSKQAIKYIKSKLKSN